MKTQMLWYFFSLVFAFQSLDTLIEESHEVTYTKSDELEGIQFLICVELGDLHLSKARIDLREMREPLYYHFNSSLNNGKSNKDQSEFEALILEQTRSGGYLILNGKACLIAKYKINLRNLYLFLPPKTVYYAMKSDTFDLAKMSGWKDKTNKLIVLKKGHPYSDCSQRNARFRCLNECFRKKARLARYFYHANETGLVQLNYNDRDRSIEESERNCFGKCKRENCKLVQLIPDSRRTKFRSETFEASPKLSAFDYWVQFTGLLCSFTGLSLNEFASIAIEFAQSKVKRRKARIALFCLKLAILLLGLATFGYLCARVALEYEAEENNPLENEGTRHLIRPKTVHLAICVGMRSYVSGSYEDKTISEIEKATDSALDDVLEGIYLDYQERLFRTDYQVQPKKMFKMYQRCFALSISLNYQMIPSNPMLAIKFKKPYRQVYLLSENENLNEKSFLYTGFLAFQKRIKLRSSGKCVNYQLKYVNCTGRQNCVERCINRKFMKTYKRTTFDFDLVIDRDWFSSSEWKTHPMEIPKENRSIFEDIRKNCLQEILDQKACLETEFEKASLISQPNTRTMMIDLQFDVMRTIEEQPSWYKLVLNLVNIQAILFGLTMLSILQMIASFVRTALRESKLVIFLLYLLCSFGASWHTYHMLDLVASGRLVPTRYYELSKRVQMPVIMFCLRIDPKLIDRNHQLTGNYLEQLTRQITVKSTIANVAYLNGSNEWIPLSRVERIFLLNMKCFRMKIDQQYEADQFYFSTESQALKVNFKSDGKKKIVHLITESRVTAKLSKIIKLMNSKKYSMTQDTSLYKYEDRFSFIRRYFTSSQEDDAEVLRGRLLELQSNEHNLRTLNLPLEQEAFGVEVNEDLFEQLHSARKGANKKTDLNYQQTFIDNHLREDPKLGSDFAFILVFLQKVVSSTNEENLGQLILSLLNVLSIWFDLEVLDLHPILPLCHDYLLIYLYFHLPRFLSNKITQFLLFACKWLKKFESPLYKRLDARKQKERKNSPILALKG